MHSQLHLKGDSAGRLRIEQSRFDFYPMDPSKENQAAFDLKSMMLLKKYKIRIEIERLKSKIQTTMSKSRHVRGS